MTSVRFLDNGSPLASQVAIMRKNSMIKILNPEKMLGDTIFPGALARIHSQKNGVYTVWVLDERTMHTIMVEVPLQLMGQYFKQQPHDIFPHLR